MASDAPAARAARKDDHVRLALQQRAERASRNEFDDLEFMHSALDGISAEMVDLSAYVDEWHWPLPFYVNGMTGGTDRTERINRDLAIAARETGMPMACGSVAVALDDPGTASGFAVIREENPEGFVMANLGVGRAPDDARRAVELLGANALQVHLNAVQETAMPEGTRDFSGWVSSLERLVAASPVPVIVKEVGFGLNRRTLTQLAGIGVRVADVSGRGGTDFLAIENARREGADFSMLSGFGQSALACLLDAPQGAPELLASGGVRHPLDVVKALAAGARAVGVAGVFLETAMTGGAESLVELVHEWIEQTAAILALLGAASSVQLTSADILVRGRLREFCELRGVDTRALANRSETGG